MENSIAGNYILLISFPEKLIPCFSSVHVSDKNGLLAFFTFKIKTAFYARAHWKLSAAPNLFILTIVGKGHMECNYGGNNIGKDGIYWTREILKPFGLT